MSDPRELSQTTFLGTLIVACFLLCGIASASPSITLSRKSGPPTSKILVSGRGFEANASVDIYFDSKVERQVVTDGHGDFEKAEIRTPRSARPGEHVVKAVEQNNHARARQPFLVRANWTQFHRLDMMRFNPVENVLNSKNVGNLKLKWKYRTIRGVLSSPALANGVLYFGSEALTGTNFYALDANTGREVWKAALFGGDIYSSPAVSHGIVYVGTDYGGLYALNATTGATVWSFAASHGVDSSPAVVDGVVYFGSYDSVYALNARTGTVLWESGTGGYVFSSPAVINGAVYVGSYDKNVYALKASNGAELWSYTTVSYVYCAPTVANSVVYVSSDDGYLYALKAKNGHKLWSYGPLGGNFEASAPAVANGVVYVGGGNGMSALDAGTGAVIWKFWPGSGFASSPAIANGVVYVGSQDNNLYALDARTGVKLWSYTTDFYVDSSPAVANGMVYVGSEDGHVYAFGLPGDDEFERIGSLQTCRALGRFARTSISRCPSADNTVRQNCGASLTPPSSASPTLPSEPLQSSVLQPETECAWGEYQFGSALRPTTPSWLG
jgi:outer membrane protein assembly factor BamB